MKLKVCGITHNLLEIARLEPDYLGFNFWKPSTRYFEGKIPELPKTIKKTGIFVDASLKEVLEKVAYYQLDAVQLHGGESAEYCKTLRQKTFPEPVPDLDGEKQQSIPKKLEKHPTPEIIKAFSIKDSFNFSLLQAYETVCDYFLFDTKGKLPGGNGYAFDWTILQAYPFTKPYFLSGGIGLENIADLLTFLQRQEARYCYAVDVNSKFETKPGHKNVEQLKTFKQALV